MEFKITPVIDEHIRLVLDDTVDVSIIAEALAGVDERLSITYGLPAILHKANAPELTGLALAQWADRPARGSSAQRLPHTKSTLC